MKAYILTLLTFCSLGAQAMTHNNNMTHYIATSHYPKTLNNSDTTKIALNDSEIIIIDNDTTVNVQIQSNETNASAKDICPEEYLDVNVEVIEGENSTRIIVHKDGDTIKNYEMNYNFQAAEEVKSIKPKPHSTDDDGIINFHFNKSEKNRFRGHWSGFEFGLNNYMTNDFSISPDEPYMEINSGKSWNFNFNFAQVSIPIFRNRFGLVSGLGLEWNNYHFSNQNTIEKSTSEPYEIKSKELLGYALKKNRLQTTYLTVPLLMEVQLGDMSRNPVAISAGIIAGLKLGSHTKVKTNDEKEKNKDDFYLQSFRYGFTTRINYNSVGLFFNYYKIPLFIDGKGPELYPFAAGLVLSFD